MVKNDSISQKLRKHLRRRLLTGLLVVVPLWVTYVALSFFVRILDGFFAPLIRQFLGFSVPGMGFILLVIFLYLIGVTATNILGRSLINFGERVLNQIPIVKNIYHATKQLIQTVSLPGMMGFKRVVLVEYPRNGLKAIAFVTNSIKKYDDGKQYVHVFIPTTPNPTSGVFEMVPQEEVIETNLTIEEAIKLIITGGLVVPEHFGQPAESLGKKE